MTRTRRNDRNDRKSSRKIAGTFERSERNDRPWRKEGRDNQAFLLQIPAIRLYAEQVQSDGRVYKDELQDCISDTIAYLKDSPNVALRMVDRLWDDRSFGSMVDKIDATSDKGLLKFIDRLYNYIGSEKSYDDLYDAGNDEDSTIFLINVLKSFTKAHLEDLVNIIKDCTEQLR